MSSRDYFQVNFRMPAELKAQLEEAARKSGRSTTAELVERLSESFKPFDQIEQVTAYANGMSAGFLRGILYAAPRAVSDYLAPIISMLRAPDLNSSDSSSRAHAPAETGAKSRAASKRKTRAAVSR